MYKSTTLFFRIELPQVFNPSHLHSEMAPIRSFFAAGLAAVLASMVLAAPAPSADVAIGGELSEISASVPSVEARYVDTLIARGTVAEAIVTAEAHIKGKQIPGSYTTSEYHETGEPSDFPFPVLESAHVVFIRTTATPTKDYKVWVNQKSGKVVGQKEISWPCPNVLC
ncbi:hypothetical protein BDV98DRAFT_569531 [Pterulicium gracile]|uniref:Uncharacterized protein n=1 Tax=Pterulicium gracile TaxID=1884261 RepID=A0A5C3QE08_9AGAR|nr:hypothetical protein BDV98DRAFT_569531 [Pterula gracilis]